MIALVRFCSRLVSIAMIGIAFLGGELRAQPGAPTVVITPPSGEYTAGQQVAITVEYCDNNGLDTATAVVEFNGVPKNWPKQYVIGNPGPCQWKLTRTGTVTMLAGSNSMRASIEDTSPMPLWSGWTTNFWTTPVPPAGVTIVRDNQYLESTPATLSTLSFVVTNTGTVQDTFTVSAVNSGLDSIGTPVAAPLSPKGKFILATGATGTVTIVVKSPSAQLATGRATLTVTGHASASTWTEITSSVAPVGPTGVVLLNPTGIVDKSLCLTIAAGPAAAAECGDLRMAYALPGVVTKNKARVPTLLYSTQAARPTVTIPAELTVTSPTLGVQYTASVQITSGPESGQTFAAGSWSSNDWVPGGRRRILATFDGAGLSTGRKTYILTIQLNGGATYTATGELLHVNRIASPFTAGWWLAGLEQLVSYDTSSTAQEKMLWVGGDGSARVYRETAINSCVFTHDPLDRPDSIVGTLSPTGCMARERRSSNGLRVLFDAAGNHVQTINRLGETTSFSYLNGALATIVLPSGTLGRQYEFAYTGGILDSVIAPGNPVARVIRISRNTGAAVAGTARSRIVAILGLDADSVRFGYEGGSGNGVGGYRATSRTDRMGIATTFTYDGAYRLASASTPASATQTVTQTLRAAEGQGIATALVLDSVYTRLDGPRTNATDVSKWWLNRLGAPTRTRNAVGMESRIEYDAIWPALPARVSDAAGLTTTATYTSRGLVWQTTVIGPLGATGGNAVSTMSWHPVWDMPTSSVDPNGVTTTRTYDAANGNLLTEYVGNSAVRATTYEYDATTKQLSRIFTPASGVADRIYYDTELGNVSKTKSPRGNVIAHYKDRLGRDTLVVSSVDAVTDTVTKVQRTVMHYDAAGRAWETITSSPAMPYTLEHNWQLTDPTPVTADTQFVRTTFDKEGRPLTINSFSRPNLGVWEQCDAPVGVCLGVPPGTEGSFDIRTYDWIGRPLTQRLGSGPKQVTYDPAGNVTSSLTRNNHTITSTYDAANRLVERIVPSVTYAQEYCQYFPPGMLSGGGGCMMKFPFYPTGAGTSLVLAADTSRFAFDAAGRMIRADNKDARIIRAYFPGGALSSETQQIRSYGTSSFSATAFTQSYTYDIGGRRISHMLPFGSDGTINYEYDAERGFLKHVVHGSDRFSFTLDAAGRQDSLIFARNVSGSYVTGVVELRGYDPDGNVLGTSRVRWDGTSFVPLLQSTLTLDARSRTRSAAISSAAPEVGAQQVRINYAGSGPVVSSERWNTLGHDTEQFRTTALGEVWRSRSDVGSQSAKYPVISQFDINGALKYRAPVRPGVGSPGTELEFAL